MTEPGHNEFRDQRLANLRELEKLGYRPYGSAFRRSGSLREVRAGFAEGAAAAAAGRLLTIRRMGKSIFAHLYDGTDRFQIYLQKNELGAEAFAALRHLDAGDHVGAEGELFTTKTGEQTLRVKSWTLLGKALLHDGGDIFVLARHDARAALRHRDLCAKALKGLCQLTSDRTAADDQQPFG